MFNGEAMFTIRDAYGSADELVNKMLPDTREGFMLTCESAALLFEQGELSRRYAGYEPQVIITAEALQRILQPAEIANLKLAIPRAIGLGYGREIEPDKGDEIKLDLIELDKKKPN